MDIRDGKANQWVWLYARSQAGEKTRYAISNAPEETTPETFRDLAIKRWPIEQSFKECKSDLGMSNYEGRSWDGFHRHIRVVMATHLFLQIIRNKYTITPDQLSEELQEVLQCMQDVHGDKTALPILTTGQSRLLLSGVLEKGTGKIRKILRTLTYKLKMYAKSFLSYTKKKINFVKKITADETG
jgi:hypothetical protein